MSLEGGNLSTYKYKTHSNTEGDFTLFWVQWNNGTVLLD